MAIELYKRGQGYYTRLCTACGAGLMAILGCYALYNKLEILVQGSNAQMGSWFRAGIPLVIFAVLAWLIYKLVNTPKFADFMIATEGEMKKVSWSTRKEVIGSTWIVITTVVLLAVLLAVVDVCFQLLFRYLGVLST